MKKIAILSILLIFFVSSCRKKALEEEEETPEETTDDTYKSPRYTSGEDDPYASLWSAVLTALKTNEFDTSSDSSFATSLGTDSISAFVKDPTTELEYRTSFISSVVGSASEQKCATAPAVFSILNPGTSLGLSTGGFKVVNGVPVALILNANVYLISYKLKDASTAPTRYAFVTVPAVSPVIQAGAISTDGTNYGYPVVAYAHAGTSGLAYEQIALALGEMQSNHITVSPVFPGEPVCKTYDTDPQTGEKLATCTGSNVLVAANPTDAQSVYQNDVTDFLGALECVKGLTSVSTVVNGIATGSSEAISSKWAQVNKAKSAYALTAAGTLPTAGGLTGAQHFSNKCQSLTGTNQTACLSLLGAYVNASKPLTFAFGLGRGANVVNLAMARAGAINHALAGLSGPTVQSTVSASVPYLQMFSCAATAGGQNTFHAGYNKLILESWVKGESKYMTAEESSIVDKVPGHALMKAQIQALLADPANDSDTLKGEAVANYIKKVDGLMNTTLMAGAVQNWGKVFTAKLAGEALNTSSTTPNAGTTYEDAQGAFLMLHGRSDKVSPISNMQLHSTVLSNISTKVQDTSTHSVSLPQVAPGINVIALEVVHGTGVDNGHIFDNSFLTGSSVSDASSKTLSTVSDVSSYVNRSPVMVLSQWLSSTGSCRASTNGQADATNNPSK